MRYEYNRRPVTLCSWTGDNEEEIRIHTRHRAIVNADKTLTIPTPRGDVTAYPGDILVWDKTIHGAICYPIPGALFKIVFSTR